MHLPFLLALFLLGGCRFGASVTPVKMTLHQQWQLQPGDRVAGHVVSSGLGDITIELSEHKLYAPVVGRLQPLQGNHSNHAAVACGLFVSPEIPAYRLRLCGLQQVYWGDRHPGQILGRGERVALSMLRKQADGTWAMVEPATKLLEQFLQ